MATAALVYVREYRRFKLSIEMARWPGDSEARALLNAATAKAIQPKVIAAWSEWIQRQVTIDGVQYLVLIGTAEIPL